MVGILPRSKIFANASHWEAKPEAPMKRPKDLDGLDLEDVVSEIQKQLYLDNPCQARADCGQGTAIWRPAKRWDAETLAGLAEIMNRYELVPDRDQSFED
jgi:hypothetical protein